MRTFVGVLAEAPLAHHCKRGLLAAHGAEWIAGLYAAILRDLLDGAQAVAAEDYVVFSAPRPTPEAAREVLVRHVPVPWTITAQTEDDPSARIASAVEELLARAGGERATAVLLTADVPSFDTGPLVDAVAAVAAGTSGAGLTLGPTEGGGLWAIATDRPRAELFRAIPWDTPAAMETIRVRCKERGIAVRELPASYSVDAPSDVLQLLDELRKHPDRAPRSAQYLVTHG